MSKTITLTATDGTKVEFIDDVIGSGAMKDVYFSGQELRCWILENRKMQILKTG